MQVFKLCLSIIRKNIPVLMIYVVIFVVISLFMSSYMTTTQQAPISFTQNKADIAFIREESSPLIDGLIDELGKIANFIDLPDDPEALQDALFFGSVTLIIRVPTGFTENFMRDQSVTLKKMSVPDSIDNTYIDLSINKYFSTAKLYLQNLEGLTQNELVQHLKSDLAKTSVVEMKTNGDNPTDHTYSNYFFNYFSYSLLSIIILGMSTLMLVFNNRDLKLRNGCSPISSYSMNMQFILANLLFTFASWLLMVLLCLMVNYKTIFTANTVYFLLNSFVFAFCCSSISFFIGTIVKSQNAISAVSNVVTLGMSFISGAFVPQEYVSASVLKIAAFTPAYWFVKANNTIANLTQFDFPHLKPVFSDICILACFGLAIFAVALAMAKKKRYD
jgi:ABC-2 type transport system permease protein